MLKLYRSTLLMYWTVSIVFLVLLVSQTVLARDIVTVTVDGVTTVLVKGFPRIFHLGEEWNTVVWFVILFAGVFLVSFIANSVAGRKYARIRDILFEGCDPDRYLAALGPLLRRRSLPSVVLVMLQNDAGVGRFARGDHEIARDTLANLRPSGMKRQRRLVAAAIAYNRAAFSLHFGDLEDARRQRDEMERVVSEATPSERRRQRLASRLDDLDYAIRLEEGDAVGVREHFEASLRDAKSEYERMMAHHRLSQIYRATGEERLEREHLDAIVAHGNGLWIVPVARQRLAQLSEG